MLNDGRWARRVFAALSLFALIHLPATATDAAAVADSLSIGDEIAGAVKIGRRTIAIPAGKWRLIHRFERSATTFGEGARLVVLAFDEITNGRLERALQISATKYSSNTRWLDDPCKSNGEHYWVDGRQRGMNDAVCARVGYQSGVVDNARGDAYQAWARDVVSRRIAYTPEMPAVQVTRFTAADFLQMTISYNPARAGIAASKRPERHLNDWNANGIESRHAHLAFYSALKEWAPKFRAAVERAFDNDESLRSSDFGEPALPTVVATNRAPSTD